MITATKLSKHYRKKIAVDDLSFTVETGKVTGFLGPNGAGKSTTMRLMLGLDNGGGHTLYDGRALNDYSNPSNVVGILLEAKAFHPTRSARNHLRVLAAAGDVSNKRVDEVLDIVGLKDVAKKAPGKFSLGMSQRLGIAAAILGSPKYLLLDEPANGLDPEGIAWLRQFIKEYADQGNAVLVSSHLLSEMAQMADNVLVIGKGRLITETSIASLVAGNGHGGVFVRVANQSEFNKILKKAKYSATAQNQGLLVTGLTTDQVGKLAFENKIAVLELSQQTASLEEAFLELTADASEYHTHTKSGAAI